MDRFQLLARADTITAELHEIRTRLEADEARNSVLSKICDELVENVHRVSFPFVDQFVAMRDFGASEEHVEMLALQHKQAVSLVVDECLNRLRVAG